MLETETTNTLRASKNGEGFNRRSQGCLQGSMLETETTDMLRASENGEGFNRRSQGCLQGSMLKGSMLGLSAAFKGKGNTLREAV